MLLLKTKKDSFELSIPKDMVDTIVGYTNITTEIRHEKGNIVADPQRMFRKNAVGCFNL